MAAISDQFNLSTDILEAAKCAYGFACLEGTDRCQTESFVDRDVPLIRCLGGEQCQHTRCYNGMTICSCPVKRALA